MTNLIDMQKDAGIDPDIEPVILRFTVDRTGNITSRYVNRIVFRDISGIIQTDETWICTLKSNPSLNNSYVAIPLQKVDANYLYELTKNNQEELIQGLLRDPSAQSIIENNAKIIKSKAYEEELSKLAMDLKKKYNEINELKEEVKNKEKEIKTIRLNSLEYPGGQRMYEKHLREIDDMLKGKKVVDPDNIFLEWSQKVFNQANAEKNKIQTELTDTKKKLSAATDRCKNLEIENDRIDKELNEKLSAANDRCSLLESKIEALSGDQSKDKRVKVSTDIDEIKSVIREEMSRYIDTLNNVRYPINRINQNTLECKSFTESRYNVLISADKKKMVIRPDDDGNILCINGRISLYGFDSVIPFKEKHSFIADWQTDGSAFIDMED